MGGDSRFRGVVLLRASSGTAGRADAGSGDVGDLRDHHWRVARDGRECAGLLGSGVDRRSNERRLCRAASLTTPLPRALVLDVSSAPSSSAASFVRAQRSHVKASAIRNSRPSSSGTAALAGQRIKERFGIAVPPRTFSTWLAEYRDLTTYARLRNQRPIEPRPRPRT